MLTLSAGFPPLSVPNDSRDAGLQTFLHRGTRFSTTTTRLVPPTVPPVLPLAPAYDATAKQKAQAKTARIPIKIVPAEVLKKPDWIRVRAGSPTTRFYEIKQILREQGPEVDTERKVSSKDVMSILSKSSS